MGQHCIPDMFARLPRKLHRRNGQTLYHSPGLWAETTEQGSTY